MPTRNTIVLVAQHPFG